jgi:isoleucyl-tRNA synthetase
MVSSLVFDEETQARMGLTRQRTFPHPYKTCIVLGHVCDREGKKESKAKGNYTPPEIILDRVRMEFAVLDAVDGQSAPEAKAWIGREDLEGMDLQDGARVVLYRADNPSEKVQLILEAQKKLPRRVVVLPASVRERLGLREVSTGLGTLPREVPGLPQAERIFIEDENTPAPGADAFRWFFYASSPPWSNTRHSLKNVRQLQKDFQVKLRNVYSFFVIYANIDGWTPSLVSEGRPLAERSVLDRWMASEIALAVRDVRRALDGFMAYDAAQRLVELVEALSNWYVRRSRARYWAPVGASGSMSADKLDAYATLYTALVTLSKLAAPFIPFFAEEMFQNLVRRADPAAAESVHLADFPAIDEPAIDERLAEEMAAVRDIVSLGLSVRTANKLKVRQPLARADVVFNSGALASRLDAYREPILEELNVRELRFMHPGHEDGAVSFRLKPNFRTLGPRLGKDVQAVKKALETADGSALHAELSQRGKLTLAVSGQPLEFTREEIDVQVEAASGFAAETGRVGVVVLHTTLTDALVDEGLLREVVSRVQAARKDLGLEFTDRVVLKVSGSERIQRVIEAGADHVRSECLASALEFVRSADAKEHAIGEETLALSVSKA